MYVYVFIKTCARGCAFACAFTQIHNIHTRLKQARTQTALPGVNMKYLPDEKSVFIYDLLISIMLISSFHIKKLPLPFEKSVHLIL